MPDSANTATGSPTPHVRRARPADIPEVVQLATEHAAYEKAPPPAPELGARLHQLLFDSPQPRLYCFVAELRPGDVAGYATCATGLSTWSGTDHLHLDCLFLRDGHRNLGLGARLIEAVLDEARRLGVAEVQWQTPDWNAGAIRFYDRLGARSTDKRRYCLPVGHGTSAPRDATVRQVRTGADEKPRSRARSGTR